MNISTILCTRHKYNIHKIIAIYRANDIKTRYTQIQLLSLDANAIIRRKVNF